MRRALLLLPTKRNISVKNADNLLKLLSEKLDKEVAIEVSFFDQLLFVVNNKNTRVIVEDLNTDIDHYDLIIMKQIGANDDLSIALASYCRMKNIKYIDSYIPNVAKGKLACSMLRTERSFKVPLTIGGNICKNNIDYIVKTVGLPLILKSDYGYKGKDNYLISSKQDLINTISDNKDIKFIIQKYIPNDGDYRFVVMSGDIKVIFKRMAKEDSHLNNISQGGKAKLYKETDFNSEIITLVKNVVKSEKIDVAGVDILFDLKTCAPYIIEVNLAPQIESGIYPELHINAYSSMINTILGAKNDTI